MSVFLDTHVVAWLHDGRADLLSEAARAAIEAEPLLVSPAVHLELTFLMEIGRLQVDAASILHDLGARIGLRVDEAPFLGVVAAAAELPWTRDPFDRLIVGQATAAGSGLVTRDRRIREHFTAAVW